MDVRPAAGLLAAAIIPHADSIAPLRGLAATRRRND
jgi:hypothetical protein